MSYDITVESGKSVRLPTAGKYCDRDIVITATGGGSSGDDPGSSVEWIGDGNTHLWITLPEGRTSPKLRVCPKGTVTVDWGDGTTPDVLTGTSTSASGYEETSVHKYAAPGDYIITLTVEGAMSFPDGRTLYGSEILMDSSLSYYGNSVYRNAIRKVEMGSGVTGMGTYAFSHCFSLEAVKIAGSITSIKKRAFGDCLSLTAVEIPNSVVSIGEQAFLRCNNLTSIEIPGSVKSIDRASFSECYGLKSVKIQEGVTSIGEDAFNECYSLETVELPDSLTSIGPNWFYNCHGLKSVKLPAGATNIDRNTFFCCSSLATIKIPDTVTSIGTAIFQGCRSLETIKIPDGVTSFGDNIFYGCCSLTSIEIPAGITSIGSSLLNGCYSLASVKVLGDVTAIDGNAFYDCSGVKCYDFTNCTTVPSLESTAVFNVIASDCEIRVPAALYDEWIAATNWTTYASKIVAV